MMLSLLFSFQNKLASTVLLLAVALGPGCDKTSKSEAPQPSSQEGTMNEAPKTVANPEGTSSKDNLEDADTEAVAILAGGCFWGMEDLLRGIPGVLSTDVGYSGGELKSPTYEHVKRGNTGHAEAVRVVFDPSRLDYARLLEDWFFRMHDPTTLNRQGNDVGTQYRSVIFYTDEAQRIVAEEVKAKVNASGKWESPVVTAIVPAGPFTVAEDYHQDYLEKHPGGYTCHFMRDDTL
jgi:peptide methionine sulfoxide reductase msrA/msrB